MDYNEKDYQWRKLMYTGNSVDFLQPGEVRFISLVDKSICLVRRGDELFAVHTKCPHNGGPMTSAKLNERGDIVCPWHRFTFDVCTGRNTSGEGFYLPTYPVQRREDGIYVGFPRPGFWGF